MSSRCIGVEPRATTNPYPPAPPSPNQGQEQEAEPSNGKYIAHLLPLLPIGFVMYAWHWEFGTISGTIQGPQSTVRSHRSLRSFMD